MMGKPLPTGTPSSLQGSCPSEQSLVALAEGLLSKSQTAEVHLHAQGCSACAAFLVGLSDTAIDVANLGGRAGFQGESQPPQFVAEFRLIRQLGKGAMGEVFLARDTFLDRLVAIKFLTPTEASSTARERFFVEARAVARLQHTNVVTLYRAGEENGRRYLVSEFVRGQSLERWKKPLPWQDVLRIGLGLAGGLATAHQHGVLHRDIKPANVIVTQDGEAKILDFGLAKLIDAPGISAQPREGSEPAPYLHSNHDDSTGPSQVALTQTGALMGTPLYMAPESWRGEPPTPQTDIYSLGALLFELCTGHPPHLASSAVALGFLVLRTDAPALASVVDTVDSRLAAVIDRCLKREPSRRFANGEELQHALQAIATKSPLVSKRVVASTLSVLCMLLVVLAGIGIRNSRQAKRQAELTQRLGQDISSMEWLLRSARQLPLHNLENEKGIVRQRIAQLQTELSSYGDLARGLGHYAIGRGHMALHEYPQALVELERAVQDGNQSPDVQYALGFVLGKHFEQAIYEARLSGGGDWAKKQLRDLEPKYLQPAVQALKNSRAMKSDTPVFLEGLIAFYQRDYVSALQHAQHAQHQAPWLYEAGKLAGDIHFELALTARDSGSSEQAEKEFAAAVRAYNEATEIGRSDGEVYEALAEAWVRQIEMAVDSGHTTEAFYASALAASDKSALAEPTSIGGPLKKAQATLMTMAVAFAGKSSLEDTQRCMKWAMEALQKQPSNPYAADVAANCLVLTAERMMQDGQDPEPAIRSAVTLLEAAVTRYPMFLWGLNDLANTHMESGIFFRTRDSTNAIASFNKALRYQENAISLDSSYLIARSNSLYIWGMIAGLLRTKDSLSLILEKADGTFEQCIKINNKWSHCYNNYLQLYVKSAQRISLLGEDPQPYLARATESIGKLRALGGQFLDLEQYNSLLQLITASDLVRRSQDPVDALTQVQAALNRCFAIAAQDAMCRSITAQAEWVAADWAEQRGKLALPRLRLALEKAELATKSPDFYPDAWQVLAETQLRLARAVAATSPEREQYLSAGLAATETLFRLSPLHPLGRATYGALMLLRAQSLRNPQSRRSAAQSASAALTRALAEDPMLEPSYASLLAQASVVTATPPANGKN